MDIRKTDEIFVYTLLLLLSEQNHSLLTFDETGNCYQDIFVLSQKIMRKYDSFIILKTILNYFIASQMKNNQEEHFYITLTANLIHHTYQKNFYAIYALARLYASTTVSNFMFLLFFNSGGFTYVENILL